MKPTVGGMPVSETSAMASTAAAHGARWPSPASPATRSSPVRLTTTVTTKNAARFIAA